MPSQNKNQYFADIRLMNYILQRIPNDIYNSMDACLDAQTMWARIKMLMQGTDISQHKRHSRLMNEFDKFIAMEGESLTSVYDRFGTLINIMDQNGYVLKEALYDHLYDHLSQFEPHVNASKEKKATKNHDPLALVANSHAHSLNSHASPAYSHSSQPYYVTHPSSVIDYEDDYQREI
ncbi:hypothetical protein Tco_1162930 [Tanacetum coccineum]